MLLQDSFNNSVQKWSEHCEKNKFHSNPNKFINCEAFDDLVAQGIEILPLVYSLLEERLAQDPETACFNIFGWSALVRKIIGKEFSIPEELSGRVFEVAQYTKDWLGQNGFKAEKST